MVCVAKGLHGDNRGAVDMKIGLYDVDSHMTNDELKKKIMDAINATDISVTLRRDDISILSDALIKAGLKFDTVVSHTATFDMLQQDRINELEKRIAEAEHRAARAGRALSCLARSFAEAMCMNGNAQYLADGFIKDAYKQAKKELAEEEE